MKLGTEKHANAHFALHTSMPFENAYANATCAASYSALQFPGDYYLAFRDLPAIFRRFVRGVRALDFGCGAGRSTRFLRDCGFEAVGIDIAVEMIRRAREQDPAGDYRLIANGDFSGLAKGAYDLVLCAFPFDNIPGLDRKVTLFEGLAGLLCADGCIVLLASAPEIYIHEWVSFTTAAFPENRHARNGDIVRIVNTAAGHIDPVEDILWTDEAYRDVFASAGLAVLEKRNPLGSEDEPYAWINETRIAPWVIYALRRVRSPR